MRKTKFKLSALISLILCFAICLTAAFSLLFSWGKTAHADRAKDKFTVIGEKGDESHDDLWIDGNNIFNGELLSQLYTALAGVDNYDDLENKVKTDPDKALTSADFRTQQGGTKNVSVWFAGKKWDVVYLTTDRTEENLVLDLWQSADNVAKASKWANRESNPTMDNYSENYPHNMYSTSLIRVQTLNNGGYMSTSGTALAAKTEKDKNSEYARFTMSAEELEGTDQESVREYLVQPQNVAYQETENAVGNSTSSYTFPNDAYGDPANPNWYQSGRYNYKGKGDSSKPETMYEAWQEDYIWLPSLAETGNDDADTKNGLWETDASLRNPETTGGVKYTWLRSGNSNNAYSAYYLNASGGGNVDFVNYSYLVRPAIHLNLTKAAGAKLPKASQSTLTYSGSEQNFTLENYKNCNVTLVAASKDGVGELKSKFDAATGVFKATDAGVYTLKFKPNDGLEWNDGGGTDEKTVTLTVKKAKIGEQFGVGGKFSQTQEYVYHADEHKYALKLPEANEGTFPLSLVGKSSLSADDITLTYIIDTHEESGHDAKKAEIEGKIEKANGGDPSELNALGEWTAYTKDGKCGEQDFDVNKPLGYCVIFKAEDPEGNHETLYGYFSVHIYNEKLTIYLKEDFDTPPTVEYGDVSHTQGSLLGEVLKKIDKIEAANADGSVTDKSGLKEKLESEAEAGKFRFYFRDSESGGTRYDVSATDDGERLAADKTYYLFLEYIDEEVAEADRKNYITFEWKLPSGETKRPSFEVVKRKITVTLSAAGHTYGDTGLESKLTATPSRDDGKNWWGADGDRDISKLITYKYKLSTDEGKVYTALQSDMPAGTYNVTAECGNANYEIDFKGDTTYTVSKAVNGWNSEPAIDGWTYGGAAGAPTAEAKFGEVKFTYSASESGEYGAEKPVNAGEYFMKAEVEGSENYTELSSEPIKFTVAKGSYNMAGISFVGKVFTYDGEAHSITISGTLPDGVSVTYEGNGKIEIGSYTVTAKFEGDSENYNAIQPITATMQIVEAATVPDEPSEEPPAADEPPAEEKPQTTPQTTDGKDGIPWWVWLIVGVGAALIIAAIIVAIIAIKRKKPEIIREVNADRDGFYDDADDKK